MTMKKKTTISRCGHNVSARDYMFCTNTHVIAYKGCGFCRTPWTEITYLSELSPEFKAQRDAKIKRWEETRYDATLDTRSTKSFKIVTDPSLSRVPGTRSEI